MEKQVISKRINEILDDLSRLSNTLFALDMTDVQRYSDNYEILSTDAALRSEKITCRLRHLLYATNVKKSEYLASAATMQGIHIQYHDEIVEISLPCLLPKRRQRQSSEYLTDPLYFALDSYTEVHPFPRFRECVVCFSHVYAKDLPTRRIRDYDNIELKQILDIISTFVMVDDSGSLCDAHHTTELGETDCTRVFIMEKENFPGWLLEQQK